MTVFITAWSPSHHGHHDTMITMTPWSFWHHSHHDTMIVVMTACSHHEYMVTMTANGMRVKPAHLQTPAWLTNVYSCFTGHYAALAFRLPWAPYKRIGHTWVSYCYCCRLHILEDTKTFVGVNTVRIPFSLVLSWHWPCPVLNNVRIPTVYILWYFHQGQGSSLYLSLVLRIKFAPKLFCRYKLKLKGHSLREISQTFSLRSSEQFCQ